MLGCVIACQRIPSVVDPPPRTDRGRRIMCVGAIDQDAEVYWVTVHCSEFHNRLST